MNVTETELGTSEQAWHTIVFTAPNGLSVERVGELDLKYKVDELVILMTNDYSELRKVVLFHPCANLSYFLILIMV